jgi:hypothetical protein
MPAETRARLAANHEASSTLVELWADCFDYGYGIDDLTDRQGSSSFFQQLLRSANSELCAGVSLLLQVRPNVKAADCFRMATEMIMKALLAREAALDDAGAKKYGHDLVALAVGCTSVKPLPQLVLVMPWIREFPEVGERYRGKEANGWDLWRLYTTAQLVAAMVVRSMTDRDTRSALYPSPTPTSS